MSSTQESPRDKRRYESPADGLKSLETSYAYWTSKITDISFQSCIALIAANWAISGGSRALFGNVWAISSITTALAAVLVSLVGAFWVSRVTYKEFYAAAHDRAKWADRWEVAERIPSEWPFSAKITHLGTTFTWLKVLLPIFSGILFVIGAVIALPPATATGAQATKSSCCLPATTATLNDAH
ncbi:hypothetical protein [Noviluteimonas dokdonensis]|uniref:hypothetical protein n=1 Tax=Noviluteimonas dokdonensis TaxID=414050 RepID=UPI001269FF02|nr:hypothetical protein [Lysobacter dokdonensis]